MGFVTCGTHGARCCWRCDSCPKCSGKFTRVGRGDYCPDCTAWLKANGYVFSTYRMDYVKAEDLPRDLAAQAEFDKVHADYTCCGVPHSTQYDTCTKCRKPLPLSSRDIARPPETDGDKAERDLRAFYDAQGVPKEKQDEVIADATAKAQPGAMVGPFQIPPVEQTAAGAQYVAPDMIERKIPAGGLRPKTAQKDGPLELERPAIDAQQGKLF